MKILFASRRPAYPIFHGGAGRSFYELARVLAEAGHSVVMIGECNHLPATVNTFFESAEIESHHWDVESCDVFGRQVPGRLRLLLRLPGDRFDVIHTFVSDYEALVQEVVRAFDPDVVCTQLEGSAEVVETVRYGSSSQAHVLHFVCDSILPVNFHVVSGVPCGRTLSACIANSHFMAGFVREHLGVEAQVLYPIVRLSEPTARRGMFGVGPRILFCNPVPLKGGDLMYEVASKMPDVRFVVLPGWGRDVPEPWRQLANAEVRAWPVVDMAEAYVSVDLVVVPTQQNEAFGRVAVEAQLCGTPVMASRHSGLAEVLGDTAILVDDFRNPAAWIEAIRRAFHSPNRLRELGRAGKAHAARFAPQTIRRRFEQIVAGLDPSRLRRPS